MRMGAILTIGGAALAIWGFTYTESHDLQSGLGEIFGKDITSDEFQFATLAGPLGAIVGVVGLVMLFVSRSKN